MKQISSFWQRQGQYVLENRYNAIIIAAVLAIVPFVAWLSLAVVALVSLRKGSHEGAKVLLASLVASILLYKFSGLPIDFLYETILLFLTGFMAAQLLKITANWSIVIAVLVVVGLVGLAIIFTVYPDYVNRQFDTMLVLLKSYDLGNLVDQVVEGDTNFSRFTLASYLLGFRVFSVIVSIIISLSFARFVQAKLFYPRGFTKEILAFRASYLLLIVSFLVSLALYQGKTSFISAVPMLVVYFMLGGLSVSIWYCLSKKNTSKTVLIIVIPLMVLPYIMVPVYALLGAFDSVLNIRLYLQTKLEKSEY